MTSQNINHGAVTQERDGYLWLATEQGLARFDGCRFTSFTGATHPELHGGGFYAVLEAPDGLFRLADGVIETGEEFRPPAGTHFIHKPYKPQALAQAVRDAFDDSFNR